MRRIFVADPALVDQRGHHFSLTRTIAQTFADAGVTTICLVNKRMHPSEAFRMVRCFTVSTYDAHLAAQRERSVAESSVAAPEVPPTRSPLVLLYRLIPVGIRRRLTPALYRYARAARDVLLLRRRPRLLKRKQDEDEVLVEPDAAAELLGVLTSHGLDSTDAVFFHTSDGETYECIVDLFVNKVRLDRWEQLPVIHLSTPYSHDIMPHNAREPTMLTSVRRLRDLGLLGTRVFLHAENELLAVALSTQLSTAFARATTIEVNSLPIPATGYEELPGERQGHPARVIYLGAAREEKGFTKLPELVANVLADPELDVEFVIQASPQIVGYAPAILQAVEALQSVDDTRLTLLLETMSQRDYRDVLLGADVVLLNYERDRYRVRGSGIAVETVLVAATAVVTPETYPAYVAAEAGVAVEYEESAADAVRAVLADRVGHRQRAVARRSRYLVEHGAGAFLRRFASVHAQAGVVPAPEEPRVEDATVWRRLA